MRRLLAVAALTPALALVACGGGISPGAIPSLTPNTANNILTPAEVTSIATAAAASVSVPLVIAVSDRRGQILAVYASPGAPATATSNYGVTVAADEEAAALARTAAFFSNDQAPLSTRTVRFISGIHFPPGVANTESAPLYSIENTNRGCSFNVTYLPGQSLPVTGLLHAAGAGLGIQTGKADPLDANTGAVNPGGVPIFKNNRVAGGIGVVAAASTANYNAVVEYAAVAATVGNGFAPSVPYPGAVVVGGVTLPFVNQTTLPAGVAPGTASGAFTLGPTAASGAAPEGDLIAEQGGIERLLLGAELGLAETVAGLAELLEGLGAKVSSLAPRLGALQRQRQRLVGDAELFARSCKRGRERLPTRFLRATPGRALGRRFFQPRSLGRDAAGLAQSVGKS